MAENKGKLTFKISLLGDAAVGKTSLAQRFVHGQFKQDYMATIGFEPYTLYQILDDKKVTYSIWDIAGHDRFKSTRYMFMKGTTGSLVVFDVTKRDTFENVSTWVEQSRSFNPEQEFILVGNKIDLLDDRRIELNEAKDFAEQINALDYIETSAKTGDNVADAFSTMGRKLLNKILINEG
jgi:small GTP-binding protein